MDDDTLIAAFMEFTGCGAREDAFHHLSCCGGNLSEAVNLFLSIGAGPSGRSGSPPPSPVSMAEDAICAPIPVPSETRYSPADADAGRRSSSGSGSSGRVSRWDSDTRVSRCHRRQRRFREERAADGDKKVDSDRNPSRYREDIFSDGDADKKVRGNHSSGRGHNRGREDLAADVAKRADGNDKRTRKHEDIFSDGEQQHEVRGSESNHRVPYRGGGISDDDDMLVDAELPQTNKKQRTVEDLFRPPDKLTYKGGFHDAKVHAAQRARWLLVNVQGVGSFASFAQNRDVWANDVVAQCVREHFVLWQVEAMADDSEEDEAMKVLCYYGLPQDRLPVVVVDPVTGQAMDKSHVISDLNGFLVLVGPYTDRELIIPVRGHNSNDAASASMRSSKKPTAAAAPMSSELAGSGQEQAPVSRKPAVPVATAVSAVLTGQPSSVEKVCKLRVRLPDGRVITKDFGSQCAVSALFAFCRSELGAGEAANRPFRLLRFVGGAREEIGNRSASFESLGLHLSTVSLDLG